MLFISDLYKRGRRVFSFEFMPPRSEEEAMGLLRTVEDLRQLNPSYVSVTYPLDRQRRPLTIQTVLEMQKGFGLLTMAHLTCVNSSETEIFEVLERLQTGGVENILALRGDKVVPNDTDGWFVNSTFKFACDLVRFINQNFNFCVGASAHPEKHPEAVTFDEDLEYLKAKVEAGCSFLITQLFLDNDDYFNLVTRLRKMGIEVPVIPGIMPVTSLKGIKRILKLNGSKIPKKFLSQLEEVEGDPMKTTRLGVEYAINQCRELLENGVEGIHFYTLNRSLATREVLESLT